MKIISVIIAMVVTVVSFFSLILLFWGSDISLLVDSKASKFGSVTSFGMTIIFILSIGIFAASYSLFNWLVRTVRSPKK